jgi:hypothetical protein
LVYSGVNSQGTLASLFTEDERAWILNIDESDSGLGIAGGDNAGDYWFEMTGDDSYPGFYEPPAWFAAMHPVGSKAHCSFNYGYFIDPGTYPTTYGWGYTYQCVDPSTMNLLPSAQFLFYRADHPTVGDSNDTGYGWFDCTGGSCSTQNAWNSRLGSVSITRSGVGSYDVAFNGLWADAAWGNVQVMDICPDIGSCGATICRPRPSYVSGSATHVPIRCRSSSTTLQDAAFMLMYATQSLTATCETVNCQNDSTFMQGYANHKTATATYTLANNRSFFDRGATQGSPVQAIGYSGMPGTYDVTFPGAIMKLYDSGEPTQVHVTAVDDGSGWSSCNLQTLTQNQNPVALVARVQCFNKSGTNVAAPFYISMTNNNL